MFKEFRDEAAVMIEKAGFSIDRGLFEEPPDQKLGDLAFPCFSLSKQEKKNPKEIAEKIAEKIEVPEDSVFQKAKPVGPYVNFFFDRKKLVKRVLEIISEQKDKFGRGEKKKEKVMVEHSQPNTHKAFHVGHLRNVCLGDSLVRILKFYGYPVFAANYINDTGAHVAKCLWAYLKYHKNREPPSERGEWLGEIYSEASRKLEEKPELKEEVDGVLQKLESGDPEIKKLWEKTRKWSLDEFNRIYEQLGVEFDAWFYDNELLEGSKRIVEELKKKGIADVDQGAIVAKKEKTGLPTCIIQKSDVTTPYLTKDFELARRKFEDYGINKSIYVVAAPQKLHFQQLFKILELYGFEQARKCFHLPYELVMLKTGKMSSREGTVVLYSQLFETAKKKLLEEMDKRHGLSDEKIAEKISTGALKYAMLNRENNKVIYFDWDEVLSFEGNSGPYLQYALVRANKILENSKEEPQFVSDSLDNIHEFELAKKLVDFPMVVEKSACEYKPHLIANYAFELTSLFSKFYEKCKVVGDKKEKERMGLVWSFIRVTKNCLDLLGMEEVHSM